MDLEMKALLVLAPVCLAAVVYALAQGNWMSAGNGVVMVALILTLYRREKRALKEQVENEP